MHSHWHVQPPLPGLIRCSITPTHFLLFILHLLRVFYLHLTHITRCCLTHGTFSFQMHSIPPCLTHVTYNLTSWIIFNMSWFIYVFFFNFFRFLYLFLRNLIPSPFLRFTGLQLLVCFNSWFLHGSSTLSRTTYSNFKT